MKPISGNEVIAEAEDGMDQDIYDVQIFTVWKGMIEQAALLNGKTMDDKIFVMSEDGTQYDVVIPSDADKAYDRAMQGI